MKKNPNIGLLLFSILFLTLPICASAKTLDCDPLKPTNPTDEQMKNTFDIKGQGAGWLKALGSVGVKDDYEKLIREQNFKNPDETNLRQSFVYLFCSLLSSSQLSDQEKLAHFDELSNLIKAPQCPHIQMDDNQFIGNGTAIETNGCVMLSGKGNKFLDNQHGIVVH